MIKTMFLAITCLGILLNCAYTTPDHIEIREVSFERVKPNQTVRLTFTNGDRYVVDVLKVSADTIVGVERGKNTVKYKSLNKDGKPYAVADIGKYEIVVGHDKPAGFGNTGDLILFATELDILFDQ